MYPKGIYCISCEKIIDGSRVYSLCNECMEAMHWVTERHCGKCGKPLSENDPGELCFDCKARADGGVPHAFDKGHACTGYGACEQAVIFSLKYGSRSDIGEVLGEALYDRMEAEYGRDRLAGMYDLVMPVPIYREKKSMRGFNHAEVMAASFCRRAGLKLDADTLIRSRETLPMKGLGPEERRRNIAGAFKLRERRAHVVENARILIIDDIFTTGATLDEIALVLRGAGASRIDFLAFAGGKDMIPQ